MSLITLRLLVLSISLFFPEIFCYRQLVSDLTEISQSSTYEDNIASRAIDGGSGFSLSSGSCSHTGVGQSEAWLRIDLKKVYSINTIEIWYRNDRGSDLVSTQRLHGYSLQYYEDEWNMWKECYRDKTPDNDPIPMPSTVPCRQHTRYIRFYTNTSSPNDQYVFLEICEVKISGCDLHQYGENCTHCSRGCNKCDIANGCVECKERFSGGNCESCTAKWYNEDCFQKCSDNCQNVETCNEVRGNCPGRCMPGYRGDICEQKCSGGMYGFKCMNTCDTCVNMSCDHITGSCDSGCIEGWTGNLCVEECSNGTYGFQCKNTCDTCVNMTCDHITGSCDIGCMDGWTGDFCVEECSNGTYGFQCKNTCDTCVNMSCDHITGSCNVGCKDGWTGETCGQVCPKGHYGHNCSGQCQNCENETCHHVTGLCRGLCKAGWRGDKCQEALKTFTGIFPFINVLIGACGSVLVVYIVIIIVVVVRNRQGKRLCNSKSKGSVSASSNRQNLNSSQNPRNTAGNRNQNDIIEEPMYCNIELLTKHDMDSCSLKKPHLDEAIVSKKSPPSETKVMSNDTLMYEDTKSNYDVDAESASSKKPLRIKNCQSRKETNCLDATEESYPKKNRKRRPDQKIPVCNVYSTSPKASPQRTGDKTPCREGKSPRAYPHQTGGETTHPPCREGTSPKACQQRTGGKTAYPPLKEGMTTKACPQKTGGTKVYPPLKEGTIPKAYTQRTGGKTAHPPLKEDTSQKAYTQRTGGKTAYQSCKEDTSPKAYQQQTDGLEDAIYLNTELENCDTGEYLVWDGEETMYLNTGVASDRSSDSSGYIKMTL